MPRDLSDRQRQHLATIEHLFELVQGPVVQALRAALDAVTANLGAVVTAQGDPAEPFVSPDDLAAIPAAWAQQVDGRLLPLQREVWVAGAMGAARDLGDIPVVDDAERLAAEWVARSRNRWLSIGDRTWEFASDQLAQGFRLGESIDELAGRLRGVAGLAEPAAVAVARTEVVSAANAGTFVQAQLSGIPARKVWLSTADARTRLTHRAADGQEQPLDQPFTVGGVPLRFPGDPLGPPAETYNCRCTPLIEPAMEELSLAAASTEPDEVHTGAMVALVPSDPGAFTLEGYEPADELHVTLWFLGEAADIPPELQTAILAEMESRAAALPAVKVEAFGAAVWNPNGEHPCAVLNIGGGGLVEVRDDTHQGLVNAPDNVKGDRPDWSMPEQRTPWSAHMCIAYDPDPLRLIADAAELLGPVKLDTLRVALGEEVHDFPLASVEASVETAAAHMLSRFGTEGVMPWHIGTSAECPSDKPHAVIKDDDGSVAGCHATEQEAQQQLEALYASEDDMALEGPTAPVSGVAIVEGLETGDGREFEPGVLTWRDLPLPLEWQIQSDLGHNGSVVVGRVDAFTRDGNKIRYRGLLDLGDEHGQEVRRKIKGGFLRGVSISPDSIKEADVELVFPEPDPDADGDPMDELLMMPDKEIYHAGRISALTIVSIPAQQEAYIQLDEEDAVDDSEPEEVLAAAVPELPPAAWFTNPQLTGPTPVTVTDDGRVFGHLAAWGTCHTGVQDACIMPPREDDFPYFCTGEVVCAGGERIAVGQLTVDTGHAPRQWAAQPAAEHYDHTGAAVADVACGADRHGIWFAGTLRPSATEDQIRALRASALSGDWRRIGGKLRLVAALAVNVPGFPIPRTAVGMRKGVQASLVAAGVVTKQSRSWRRTADLVAAAIGRDPVSRRRELVQQVHGG